jgi:hypothetical protein
MMIIARQHERRDFKRLTDPWYALSGITPHR